MKNQCSVPDCPWEMHSDTKKCHFHSLDLPLPQNVDWSQIVKLDKPNPLEESKKHCTYCINNTEHNVPRLKE